MTDAISIIVNLLDANWSKSPKPSIEDIANLDRGDGKRVRLQDKDVIRIFETAHNEAQPELLYDFVNEHINLTLDIRTVKSRERLSVLRNEVRRILHGFRKGDNKNIDRIIFKTRTDLSDRSKKLFRYTMQCEVVTFSLTAGSESTFINPETNQVSGADVFQSLSTTLTEISQLTPTNNFVIVGNGNNWGMRIDYAVQDQPNGLAEAFIIAEKFIGEDRVSLILGDNIFFGQELSNLLKKFNLKTGASIFAYPVNDPERYGVVEFDRNFKVKSIIEKPKNPKSKYAITGLYMFDNKVIDYSKKLKPSKRGELEITELHEMYLRDEELNVNILGRATGWFDTGTFDSLHEASSLIKTLEKRQGLRIGYPEEVAWRNGWIDEEKLRTEAMKFSHNEYGQYLLTLIED